MPPVSPLQGSRLAPAAPLALPGSAQAAAMWRMQWLSALQWHNACRAGQPVRAGACWPFIPLDPNDTVLEVRWLLALKA